MPKVFGMRISNKRGVSHGVRAERRCDFWGLGHMRVPGPWLKRTVDAKTSNFRGTPAANFDGAIFPCTAVTCLWSTYTVNLCRLLVDYAALALTASGSLGCRVSRVSCHGFRT